MGQSRLATILVSLAVSLAISIPVSGATAPAPSIPSIPVTGQVVDAQGRAVSGARVELAPIPRASEAKPEAAPVSTAVSDASGGFSLKAPDAGMWTIRIKSQGLTAAAVDLIPLLEPVKLEPVRLQTGAPPSSPRRKPGVAGPRLTGRVLDRLTRKPIAGAFVWPREDPGAAVRTDSAGTYILVDPPRGGVLAAAALRHLPAEAAVRTQVENPKASESAEPGPDLLLSLRPGRAAFGVVVDEAGRPVAAAEVRVLPAEEREPDFALHPGTVARAAADSKGRFTLDLLPADRVDLEVRARGFAPTLVRGLPIAPGEGAFNLGSVVLASGARLEGIVEDPEGNPVEGATVTLQTVDQNATRLALAGSPPEERSTVTGADGRFEVAGLQPGEAVGLLVKRQGYASRVVSRLQPPLEEPVRVVLDPASRLTGRVLDERNGPVPAAQVVLRRQEGIAGVGTTDAEGRFLLEGVQAGRFALDASAQGHLAARVDAIEVSAGADLDAGDVILPRGAALEGTVSGPDGSPAEGAVVRALPVQGSGPALLFVVPEARTDADGHYRLEGLHEGRQSVVAEHPSYTRAAREIEIQDDEARLDLRLGEGWEVAGRAVDASGRGIAGVRIELSSQDGGGRETLSGADGGFRFAGVGEGLHRLQGERQGYARPPLREVRIAGGPVRDVELRFDRGAVLSGQIQGLSFQDLARVQVAASQEGSVREQQGHTDYQGRYRVDDLAPGEWRVVARLPDGRLAQDKVTVSDRGAVLDLEFEHGLSLSGRVLAGGSPVAGAFVHLRTGDGVGTGSRSGPQGEFRIEGLAPGVYNLLVVAPDSRLRHEETLDLRADRQIVIQATPAPAGGSGGSSGR